MAYELPSAGSREGAGSPANRFLTVWDRYSNTECPCWRQMEIPYSISHRMRGEGGSGFFRKQQARRRACCYWRATSRLKGRLLFSPAQRRGWEFRPGQRPGWEEPYGRFSSVARSHVVGNDVSAHFLTVKGYHFLPRLAAARAVLGTGRTILYLGQHYRMRTVSSYHLLNQVMLPPMNHWSELRPSEVIR
ncbi:MAG: hypothetical protein KatS3mg110_3281 [Pirellulaceae bacterium]|nr:MAG: hypothetical protein KatS3mg110_3281 [Pirellulaceae bacterium]